MPAAITQQQILIIKHSQSLSADHTYKFNSNLKAFTKAKTKVKQHSNFCITSLVQNTGSTTYMY